MPFSRRLGAARSHTLYISFPSSLFFRFPISLTSPPSPSVHKETFCLLPDGPYGKGDASPRFDVESIKLDSKAFFFASFFFFCADSFPLLSF